MIFADDTILMPDSRASFNCSSSYDLQDAHYAYRMLCCMCLKFDDLCFGNIGSLVLIVY